MVLTIALNNGTEIVAKRLSSATYPALAALLWEEDVAFPDLITIEAKQKVAPLMFRRLRDPEFIKSLAFALVTIFPDIPEELVWYNTAQKPPFGVAGLALDEILQILISVSDAIKIKPVADTTLPAKPPATKPKVAPPTLAKRSAPHSRRRNSKR